MTQSFVMDLELSNKKTPYKTKTVKYVQTNTPIKFRCCLYLIRLVHVCRV